MGIRGLTVFLRLYPVPLLSSVEVHNQYVLVDCRALLFNLVFHARDRGLSGNYFDFRQKVLKFFHNLQRCDIKPIMIYDGFLRCEDEETFAYLNIEYARSSIEITEWNVEDHFRRKLFVMIMKQTAAELNVPWFSARPESFEDLAALSKLLKIPVWSNNTIFAPFDIDVPYFMFHHAWREEQFQPQESNGRMVIKTDQFSFRELIQTFKVKEEYFSLLCSLFDEKNPSLYENYRNYTFKKNMMIPRHLRTTQNTEFRRPNLIENALLWFSRTRKPVEKLVDDVVSMIPDKRIETRARKEILRKHERYKNPKVRKILLLEMIEKISDAEICKLLEGGLEQAICDDSEAYLDNAVLRRMYKGNFPIWVPRFLHCQASNLPFASHRYIFSNALSRLESEHPILTEIPKIIYQLLLRKGKGEVIVNLHEVPVSGNPCLKAGSIRIEQSHLHDIDVYKPKEDVDEADMDQRKDFLLNILFPNSVDRSRYEMHQRDLCEEMKLTLAITNFLVVKERPELALVKAMVAMFSLMQTRIQLWKVVMQNASSDVFENDKTAGEMDEADKPKKADQEREAKEEEEVEDSEERKAILFDAFERSALLWEECFENVITLNQILNFPFPEPSLGKFYNFWNLWYLHESISSGKDVRNMIKSKEFSELFQVALEIVYQ